MRKLLGHTLLLMLLTVLPLGAQNLKQNLKMPAMLNLRHSRLSRRLRLTRTNPRNSSLTRRLNPKQTTGTSLRSRWLNRQPILDQAIRQSLHSSLPNPCKRGKKSRHSNLLSL